MTDDIRSARCLRRRLERRWRSSKSPADRILYNEQKQRVSHLIDQAQKQYYSSYIADCSGDQKRLFGIINKLLNRKKQPVFPNTNNDKDLANQFCDYFVGNITNIQQDLSR